MTKSEQTSVRVITRFRPFNQREISLGQKEKEFLVIRDKEIEIDGKIAKTASGENLKFCFSKIFNPTTTQEQVFEVFGGNALKDLFKGYHNTIFAYGQTGAGKSWSMMGDITNNENRGIIPRIIQSIFENAEKNISETMDFSIGCSYLQVYMEEIADLLDSNGTNLEIRESATKGIYIDNLSHQYVTNQDEVFELLKIGDANRRVSATKMNATSSRSHCCFIIDITQKNTEGVTISSKLNLVDLAGSERVDKTGASGTTLEEAKKINLSLSCLSHCISALSTGGQHVPFRSSKLTRLLQHSLGGNCKTTVLIACSPHENNIDETISSLRFGERCATIKCEAKANITLSVEQLEEAVRVLKSKIEKAEKLKLQKITSLRGDKVYCDVSTQFPEEEEEKKLEKKVNPGFTSVVGSIRLQNYTIETFDENVKKVFINGICDLIKPVSSKIPNFNIEESFSILSIKNGLNVTFNIDVPHNLAFELSCLLTSYFAFSRENSFSKFLQEKTNISDTPKLLSTIKTRIHKNEKELIEDEVDMLYKVSLEKQLEVDSLLNELHTNEIQFKNLRDTILLKQSRIDALEDQISTFTRHTMERQSFVGVGGSFIGGSFHSFSSSFKKSPQISPRKDEQEESKPLLSQPPSPTGMPRLGSFKLDLSQTSFREKATWTKPPSPQYEKENKILEEELSELSDKIIELETRYEMQQQQSNQQEETMALLENEKKDIINDLEDLKKENDEIRTKVLHLSEEVVKLRNHVREETVAIKSSNLHKPLQKESVLKRENNNSDGVLSFIPTFGLFGGDNNDKGEEEQKDEKKGVLGWF